MIRLVYMSIRWELLQLYLAILFTGSWYAMLRHVFIRTRSQNEPLRETLERCSVGTYICTTLKETGYIGPWFWMFAASLVLLIVTGFRCLSGEFINGSATAGGEYLWPIL